MNNKSLYSILFVVLSTLPMVQARYFDFKAIDFLDRMVNQYFKDPTLQFVFLLVCLWTIAYCVIMWGMVRGNVLANNGTLTYQGKILATTLAAFLPFFYVWLMRNVNTARKVAEFMNPFAFGLGIAGTILGLVIIYYILTSFSWFSETDNPPAQRPPQGGNPP